MKPLAILATLAMLTLTLPLAAAAPSACDVGPTAVGPGWNTANLRCSAAGAAAYTTCTAYAHPPEPVVPPEPVSPADGSCLATASTQFVSPIVRVGFNPQPEPPAKWVEVGVFARGSGLFFGCEVSFNPQPEPPACFVPVLS